MSVTRTYKESITSVRNLIANKIQIGIDNFNATLNIDKTIHSSKHSSNEFINLFAALTVLRANAEASLKDLLVNSIDEPTITTVTQDNVKTLAELRPDFWSNNE